MSRGQWDPWRQQQGPWLACLPKLPECGLEHPLKAYVIPSTNIAQDWATLTPEGKAALVEELLRCAALTGQLQQLKVGRGAGCGVRPGPGSWLHRGLLGPAGGWWPGMPRAWACSGGGWPGASCVG